MNSEVGNLLLEAGLLDEDALQQVLGAVIQFGGTFVQNLVRLELVDDERVAGFLAARLGLPQVETAQFDNLPAFLTRMVSAEQVLAHRLIPIMLHQGTLYLAMSDPTDRVGLEEVAFSTGYQTRPVVARDADIQRAMVRYYDIPPEVSPFAVEPSMSPKATPVAPAAEPAPGEPATRPETVAAGGGPQLQPDSETVSEPVVEDGIQASERAPATGLDELFAGRQEENDSPAFFELTKVKEGGSGSANNIAEAVLEHARVIDPEAITVLEEPKRVPSKTVAGDSDNAGPAAPPAAKTEPPAAPPAAKTEPPAAPARPQQPAPAAGDDAAGREAVEALPAPDDGEEIPVYHDVEQVRRSLEQAGERDEVARLLVGLARAHLPRVALFVVRKELLVGWMGAGGGITTNQVKGIMIPLSAPSVFKTVFDTQTDYFGSLPRTTINDVFISALGRIRPARVLLIPISVHHRPVAILYGDCAEEQGFARDLSPLHLTIYDVARALERIILEKKRSGRRVLR